MFLYCEMSDKYELKSVITYKCDYTLLNCYFRIYLGVNALIQT